MSGFDHTMFDPEVFGHAAGKFLREEVIDPLSRRLDALESKRTEQEPAGELSKALERIEALEQALEGRSLKFMGRWNRDGSYCKGDVTSHSGSLWVAARPTRDPPAAGSDWTKMLTTDQRGGFVAGDAK